MEIKASVVPVGLRSNKAFRADLKALAELKADFVRSLAKRLGAHPRPSTLEKTVEEMSGQGGPEPGLLYRAASTLAYVMQRSREVGAKPNEVMEELNGILAPDKGPQLAPSLADCFSYSDEERRETLSREAFAASPTFLESLFTPALVAAPSSKNDLVPGLMWTLSYRDAANDNQSITFGISPGELREVAESIDDAMKELARLEVLRSKGAS